MKSKKELGAGERRAYPPVKIFCGRGVDKHPPPAYNNPNNQTAQTSDGEKYPARQTFREPPMVGTGRRAAGEWTPEGGPNSLGPSRDRRVSHPLSIGARMMVRVSERTFVNVNLGGIAEAAAFVPCGARAFLFAFSSPNPGKIRVICHSKSYNWRKTP